MFSTDAPPPEEVLEMEPEELAPFILRYLQKQTPGTINRHNFSLVDDRALIDQLGNRRNEYAERLMEAWMYLERQGFVAPQPGDNGGNWMFVTRRGKQIVDAQDFDAYKQGYLLPSEGLDAVLVQKVKPSFVRGDYDAAVLQAFKEVEVRVRQKAALTNSDIGVTLMRKAFNATDGVLTDMSSEKGEQVARMELFAGAIGAYKNPSSHRDVEIAPEEASDLIRLANQLLRIVERLT